MRGRVIARVEVEGLALERGERLLFRGLDFAVEAGTAAALTGPNGAGKTSLLRAMAGFLRPLAGAVRFRGGSGELPKEEALQDLHWAGWQDGLKSWRTAHEELRFWTAWAGGTREAADAALETWGLAAAGGLEVRRLSAGQRRRLALARLEAAPRALWLLDEPLAPLDAHWRARFGEAMTRHLDGGGLIIAAVHDPLPVPASEVPIGVDP